MAGELSRRFAADLTIDEINIRLCKFGAIVQSLRIKSCTASFRGTISAD